MADFVKFILHTDMKPKSEISSRIFSSCVAEKKTDGEKFVDQHVIDYIAQGTSEAYLGDKVLTYKAGDLRYVKRNTICKFYKQPPDVGQYESITICIHQNILQELYNDFGKPEIDRKARIENVMTVYNSPLFRNYLASLGPYIDSDHSKQIIDIKTKEAVVLLLEANPILKNTLFDFSEPGKIDLENFMSQHFKMNGSLEEFAYLTGRSLSTFKRDFASIFHTTPNKWLLTKRLEEANYLIMHKNLNPTNAYYEVGFKDYSHFSVAFKKQFGYPPSMAAAIKASRQHIN